MNCTVNILFYLSGTVVFLSHFKGHWTKQQSDHLATSLMHFIVLPTSLNYYCMQCNQFYDFAFFNWLSIPCIQFYLKTRFLNLLWLLNTKYFKNWKIIHSYFFSEVINECIATSFIILNFLIGYQYSLFKILFKNLIFEFAIVDNCLVF